MANKNQSQSTHGASQAHPKAWLLAVAAPKELDAVLQSAKFTGDLPVLWELCRLSDRVDVVWTGVGKANAAGGVARVLDTDRHLGVLSVGVAGALPGSDLALCDVVCADRSVFGDEGVETPNGFVPMGELGFGAFASDSDSIKHDQSTVDWLGAYADHIGPVACVSLCSGTDEQASQLLSRTDAIGEAMEGAAVALAANRVDPSIRTGELRVISNTTGDRDAQQWDLDGALKKLTHVLGRLIQEAN